MLSRNAQGLYWMGRHLERAQHGCRLLSDQLATMEDRPVEQIDQSWRRLYRSVERTPLGGFLAPSRFARASPALAAFTGARELRRAGDPLTSLLEAARALHGAFRYEPGSTAVDSPIEHILETGRGVCQDYTHVMIAVARSWGIPSRYVSGYIHLEGSAGEQTPEGASHAWAEFLLPDLGWVGMDPTNDALADHRHVRVAVGRDYGDAAPTRGAVFGGGESRLDVRVTVTEGAEPEPAGSAASHAERPNLRDMTPARPLPRTADQ